MTIGERNRNAVRSEIIKTVEGISSETRFRLLPVADHRRPGLFEPKDCILYRSFLYGSKLLVRYRASSVIPHGRQQFLRARDAANRLGWYRHCRSPIPVRTSIAQQAECVAVVQRGGCRGSSSQVPDVELNDGTLLGRAAERQ
jgi:hypothetical protein